MVVFPSFSAPSSFEPPNSAVVQQIMLPGSGETLDLMATTELRTRRARECLFFFMIFVLLVSVELCRVIL